MKKKLGLVISHLQEGGAQRVASILSFGLAEKYDLSLILHDGQKISYAYRGQVIDLQTPVTGNLFMRLLNFLIRIFKLKRFKSCNKPQAVISFMEGANFINILTGRTCRVIASVRNYKSRQTSGFIGQLFAVLIKVLYGHSDLIVAASEGIKTDLADNFSLPLNKIKVIYNPCDLDYIIEKSEEELDSSEKAFFEHGETLITVGSLTRQKGQWHLLRVLNEVRKSRPLVKLAILGEGELRGMLSDMITALQLKDEVLLAGFKNNPFKYMNRAKIFVLPSLYEGFPNALVEAMACGVPVVASDCPSGPREILAPETDFKYQTAEIELAQYGVLVPVCGNNLSQVDERLSEQEKTTSEAVIMLLKDKSLYDKYKALSLVRAKHFESNSIVKQWVEMING